MRGGVNYAKKKPASMQRSHAARVLKRADDRARLQLYEVWDAKVGERLLVDSEWETLAADVYAVHPEHRLLDVTLRGGLDESTSRVWLRRPHL